MDELLLATVGTVSGTTATLIFDGDGSATTKAFKAVKTGRTLVSGDRVLVARVSGSYVIVGAI